MATYRICIGDRKRTRIIRDAPDVSDAIRAAVGQRLMFSRRDSRSWSGDVELHEIAVRAGPTRHGSTPFRNVWVHVYID